MGNELLKVGDVLRVAAEASCTVETVRRYCRGERMYRRTLERLDKALVTLGFEPSVVRGSEATAEVA